MRSPLIAGLFVAVMLAVSGRLGCADQWPQWRGPHHNGISDEKNLPITWSSDTGIAWKTPLPGPAGASPVVWGDRVFLTTVDADQLLLQSYATKDGAKLWSQTISRGNEPARGDEGNSASPSPLTNGELVWTFMGDGTLACLTADKGEEKWRVDIQKRYGKFDIQFGMTSTPVLDGDVLYMQLIHGDGKVETQEARVIALEAATGKEIWQVPRMSDGTAENEHSYASPIIYRDAQREFLLTHGNDYAIAYDMKTGKEIWRCGNLNVRSNYDPTLRFVASPAAVPGFIVIPTAKGGPVEALRPDGTGDVTNQPGMHFWRFKKTPDVPSPIIVDDIVYLCMHDGDLAALERDTGKQIYFERTHRQRHRASPVYADGALYLTARDGRVTVVKTGREFKILAENELGEDVSSSPAISGGTIYLRSFQHLFAIRK